MSDWHLNTFPIASEKRVKRLPMTLKKIIVLMLNVRRAWRRTTQKLYFLFFWIAASSGRRVAARDSRAGEEDWTKRKKQNKTSKAEAEEQKSVRRPRAERVEAGLQRRKWLASWSRVSEASEEGDRGQKDRESSYGKSERQGSKAIEREREREKEQESERKLDREPRAHTYIFQCVQKTSVPKCNIN